MVRSVLHDILEIGVKENASDWHIREDANVGLRIDGKLVDVDFRCTRPFLDDAIRQIATPVHIDEFNRTGDSDFAFEEEGGGRFRANLHKQRGKTALTLRFVKGQVPEIKELGLPEAIGQIAESNNGIVLVTGTTGSGKSTTLAGMIRHINNKLDRHIITIEDPIEYVFADDKCVIEQREVGLDAITFQSALIHVLRQDPDIIVIGEMRDRTTFETALTAAETGHLVFTTLHTTNAAQSIMRVLDLYPNDERDAIRKSLATSLQAIISQRLVVKATGTGVVPAVEILTNSPIVHKLIYENKLDKLDQAIEAGHEDGMISLNRFLLGLVNAGTITEEAALETSDNREALQMNLKGIFLSTDRGGIIT